MFVLTRESFVIDTLFPVKDMWTTVRLVMKVTVLQSKAATKDIVSLERFGLIQHKTLSGGENHLALHYETAFSHCTHACLNLILILHKKEESFYQQIGLKFEEETSEMLHLEHGSVWC